MINLLRKLIYQLPISIRIPLLKKVSLLYHDAGLGDTLLVAAVAREIKHHYGENINITVNCEKSDLLNNNKYIDTISNRYDGIDLNYHFGKARSTKHFDTNLIEIMCSKVGIKNPAHTVDLFLSDEELKNAKNELEQYSHPIVTIQTTSGNFDANRKHWPEHSWTDLVKLLNEASVTVIQLGSTSDKPINGTINLINKKSIRESAAIISNANLHIGIVSSLMHVAEAVSTPAIILFGGFEKYAAHDYKNIIPIESKTDCSPCGLINTNINPCPFGKKCMISISAQDVYAKVKQQLHLKEFNNA